MRAICATILLLAVSPAAMAQRRSSEPTVVTVPVGRLAQVPLDVDGDEISYAFLGTDADAFREYDPDPKRIRLRVIGYKPGTAWVVAFARKADKLLDPVIVKVTIGAPEPAPPMPAPGPAPPPPPSDPLAIRLAEAFRASSFTRARELAQGLETCALIASTATDGTAFFGSAQVVLKATLGGATMPTQIAAILGEETQRTLPRDPARKWGPTEQAGAKSLYERFAKAVREAGGVQ